MNTMSPFLVFALAVMVIIAGYICEVSKAQGLQLKADENGHGHNCDHVTAEGVN